MPARVPLAVGCRCLGFMGRGDKKKKDKDKKVSKPSKKDKDRKKGKSKSKSSEDSSRDKSSSSDDAETQLCHVVAASCGLTLGFQQLTKQYCFLGNSRTLWSYLFGVSCSS